MKTSSARLNGCVDFTQKHSELRELQDAPSWKPIWHLLIWASGRHHAAATGASLRCCHCMSWQETHGKFWRSSHTCPTCCPVHRLPLCFQRRIVCKTAVIWWLDRLRISRISVEVVSLEGSERLEWLEWLEWLEEVRSCAKTLSCAVAQCNTFCRVEDWTHSMELRSQPQFAGMFPSSCVLLPRNWPEILS